MLLWYNQVMESDVKTVVIPQTEYEEMKESIAKMELLIKYYEEQFLLSKRRQFGSSSEASPEQLRIDNIFNEAEEQADQTLPEPVFEEITYKRKKRVGKREEDLAGLPVERVDYELPESERICPECGELMRDIGVMVRDELEIIPARVIHKEHAVHAYGCSNVECEEKTGKTTIVRADSPAPLISGSLASTSAVAHLAVQKYVNGVPLYRQEKGFTYDNVVLSRQTMANWLVYCAQNYLAAFYSLLIAYLLKETVLHADETTVQVLHEPGRAAQTKSYEWLYRTSGCSEHQIVIYEYQETRKQEYPKAFLKDFKGYLHTDGYQVYHNLPSGIVVVGCWSHARRYWEKLYETIQESKRGGSNAERGLVYCNLLFAYEDEFRDLTPEERVQKRLEYSKPVSDEFFAWAGSLNALPKSLFGEAIHYTLSQRVYLENVYLDGRLELSNNRAERSIKPFVQGRKQWLFSNTPNGAETSSILYSIIETAKENNLHPFQYIKHLLDVLPSAKTSELEALLPLSESLPERCRAPVKTAKPAPRKKDKGALHLALVRMRERFRGR
jgi:transposase